MALEGQHPAYGLAAAEQAQALRAAQQAQEAAAAQAAAAGTQARAAARLSGAVDEPQGVEGSTMQGDRRGARSFDRPPKGHGPAPEAPPPGDPPSDPSGRGAELDVQG
jgi:multidrug efflux pump subunit AcrA (membrane-fusion protein)